MTRPAIALLVTLCASPVAAQSPRCTYDTCALRVRERFVSGVSIVQGPSARRVARLGMFAPHVDVLASAPDSAKAHYLAGGANQVSAGDHLQQSIWFYNRDLPRGPQ